jgi:hypothetical protein
MWRRRWFSVFLFGLLLFGCATGGTYFLRPRYEPLKEFPSLQEKLGPRIAFAPFRDERPDTLYIGQFTPVKGVLSYYKSDPAPLETAILEGLNEVLLKKGLKTMSVPAWDGTPETLRNIGSDSILLVQIKKFWVEAKDDLLLQTRINTSVHLVIHLGVKKEEKVFIKNVEVERERTVFGGGLEHMARMVNETLTEIFDGLLSNPY